LVIAGDIETIIAGGGRREQGANPRTVGITEVGDCIKKRPCDAGAGTEGVAGDTREAVKSATCDVGPNFLVNAGEINSY
jgi:hypothetical protein